MEVRSSRPSSPIDSPWQEIDIEFLGKDPTKIHLNIFYNPGPEGATHNQGDLEHQSPTILELGFDASAAFHEYAFEWDATHVRWYVDGRLIHTKPSPPSPKQPVPELPQQLMMNLWTSEGVDWAGPRDDAAFPAQAEYDFVEVYRRSTPDGR